MAEWFNASVLKTDENKIFPGFESLSLRILTFLIIYEQKFKYNKRTQFNQSF